MSDLLSNVLLLSASLGAMLYCYKISKRLQNLARLDHGLGRTIATLSLQVDDLKKALESAKQCTEVAQNDLAESLKRAESARRHLELLIAAMQIPQSKEGTPTTSKFEKKKEEKREVLKQVVKEIEPVRVPWKMPEPLRLKATEVPRPNRMETNKRSRRLVDLALANGTSQ
ncbi:hypothetical protein ACMA5I_00835 [Paracoccaceae bacterium GXU_MW_L88]